jgi:hypothetical protein
VAAQRTADDRQQPLDPQMIDQLLLELDDIADRYQREIRAVDAAGRRVLAVGPRGAAAAAQHIRADHEIAVRIDRLARADGNVPPAEIVVLGVLRRMGVPGQGMANEYGIVPRCVQRAIGLVSHGDRRQLSAAF